MSAAKPDHLRIASARSAKDLRLIDALARQFQKRHPDITISVSSGGVLQVLEDGRNGMADVLLSHHELAESRFIQDGYALRRTRVMYTEYALFGPPGDPLGLSKENDIVNVFRKLAKAQVDFHVPSPQSGTNMKIEEIWTMAGIDPDWIGYENTGASGFATLLQAAEFEVYAVAEMATYVNNKEKLEGKIIPLYRDDLNLRNIYSVLVVDPARVPGVNSELAMAFHDYIVSEEGQQYIKNFSEQTFNASILIPAARFDPELQRLRAQQALEKKTSNLRFSIGTSIALLILLAVSAALFIRVRNAERKHLESKMHSEAMELARDEILQSNNRLQREIEERKLTEARLSEVIKRLNESERELKGYRDHLEALVKSRTRELEAAVTELQAFSYSVSHDLRSPLRSINGFSYVLLEETSDTLNEENRYYLSRIIEASKRMDHLIDGLLTLSRISSHDMLLKQIDLSELADEILENLQTAQEGRDIRVDVEGGLYTYGDENLVRVLLENLLCNALKYTRCNQETRITLGKTKANTRPCFYVRDNGIGFDMKYAGKLFRPFERLHSDSAIEGHGIGLSTVQRIVHRHGGTIWADSKPGNGATFYFTLTSFVPYEASTLAN
ncbi:MAG: ATP-binding protein [Gammaproteobacteria bacterium]